jgi:hypothetical protein
LIRRPLEVVKEMHALLGVYSSAQKVTEFIRTRLDATFNRTGTAAGPPAHTGRGPGNGLAASSLQSGALSAVGVHETRAWAGHGPGAPLAPPGQAPNTAAGSAAPAGSLPAGRPTPSPALRYQRKRLKTEFGTVRPPRACERLDPMSAWPECEELTRIMHPLYLC